MTGFYYARKKTTSGECPIAGVTEWVRQQTSGRGLAGCNLVTIGDGLGPRVDIDGVLCVGYQDIRGSGF